MSEEVKTTAATTEEQKHDVEYASEETKNAVSKHSNRNKIESQHQMSTLRMISQENRGHLVLLNTDARIFSNKFSV